MNSDQVFLLSLGVLAFAGATAYAITRWVDARKRNRWIADAIAELDVDLAELFGSPEAGGDR